MRAGGCTVQQALTPEAAATVKQAVALAHRRGHAQVTPLHVATTMLTSSPTGLLRSTCTLHSHSHPLHCKALELCFNVALNRLPASSSSSPILGGAHHHHHHPSLSNALVAAFKRAQAHQRRGSIESQQQPLLTVKIELEQLIISILDDPSVSRVMREAGFSSTQVKAKVEQAVSITQPTTTATTATINPNPKGFDDVWSVVDSLASGMKRSMVVVGESLAYSEGVVKGVMDRVEKGEVPEVLKSLQFITLPLFSFSNLNRDEVEKKVGELKSLVKSCCVGPRGAAVLYLGDLRWVAEYYRAGGGGGGVEHVLMEIKRLVYYGGGDESNGGGVLLNGGGRFWVMGVATYQTYKRCKVGNPSLEAVLDLHALTLVPTGTLELTLNCDSDSQSKRTGDGPISWPIGEDDGLIRNQLTCSKVSSSSQGSMVTSTLPPWLQQYKEETKRSTTTNDKDDFQHQYSSEITLHFSSVSPSSSISSFDQPFSSLHHSLHPWPITKHSTRFYLQENNRSQRVQSNPNPNSTSSIETMDMEYLSKFKEINAENLKILCNAMEEKVPWQKSIIPDIASTILQCRSGMMRRKERERNKEETWLFFQGGDVEGKEKIAREIASLVFGSSSSLVSIELGSYSSTRSDSTDDIIRNKRCRSEASHSYLERFFEAVNENPHRVFLVEDIEQVDSYSLMGMKWAIERGRIQSSNGEEVSIRDAIIILSCESFDSRSRACSPPIKQKLENGEKNKVQEDEQEMESSVCLDLNLCVVDEEDIGDCSIGNVELVESVDRAFFFKLPEDL